MGPLGGGGSITDLRSLLPPVCLLTAALPLALVPRNCNPASPGLLLLLRRVSGGSPDPCRVHASGCTSVPLDPAALLPALRCHVKWRQGSQVRQWRVGGWGGCWMPFVCSAFPYQPYIRAAPSKDKIGLFITLTYMRGGSSKRARTRLIKSRPRGYDRLISCFVLAVCFHSWGCMNGAS